MSDYSITTDFSVKDGLTTGDPDKIILGADFDTEFTAISTAVATKYDVDDLATTAEAQAASLNTVLMTPSLVGDWGNANAGIVGDLQGLIDPAADRILFWDDSAGSAAFLTVSTGLSLSGTSLSLSHLGLQSLTDPNADRFLFWDDSAGATAWLTPSSGLVLSGTTITVDHNAAVNYVADQHVAHSGVSISTGTGLTGGGTIAASRTISLNTADDHNLAHSGISISAGSGLTGGGTIAASRTIAMNWTISTAAPSGTPADGQLWVQY